MTVCGIKHADGVCVMGKCPYFKKCCPAVWDKSGEPMTNEEWFCSLSTEEKAEWLSEKLDYCQIMWYWACDKCTWSKKHESCMNDKEKWLEWLKQPHTFK